MSRSVHLSLLIVFCLVVGCVSTGKQAITWQEYMAETGAENPLELHYDTYGQGDPVIFLHGLGANLYTWRHLIAPLESHNRLMVFDLKGFGESPKPLDGQYSMFDQAELIYRFILTHDLRRLTLVGHSFGGAVAMLVAVKLIERHPGRLSRLIVIDTVSYPQELPGVIRMLRTPLLGVLGLYLIPDRVKVRHLLKLIYYDDRRITPEDVAAYAAPLSLPGAKYAMRQSALQILPDNLEEIIAQYPRINVPALIIWGREDRIIPLRNGVRLHQAIRDSQLVIIDRCGHDPPEERPDETVEVVRKFLRSQGPP